MLEIWIYGCSLFYRKELWVSKSAGQMATEIYFFFWFFSCLTIPLFFVFRMSLYWLPVSCLIVVQKWHIITYKLTWQNRFIQSKISVMFTTYIGMPIQSLKKCWIQNPCLQWISGFKESNSMDQAYR